MDIRIATNWAAERLFQSCGPETVRDVFNVKKAKNETGTISENSHHLPTSEKSMERSRSQMESDFDFLLSECLLQFLAHGIQQSSVH